MRSVDSYRGTRARRGSSHLLILGGGYIGLEFAQAVRRFGSSVTIIERSASLIHQEDRDVTEAMHQLCHDEGIEIFTQATVTRVNGRSGYSMSLHTLHGGSEVVLQGSHLLVAGGRVPNTEGIGLDVAGIETMERGHVQVNERLETTAPDI